jgi:uroporphyrinogen decarboxylase
MQTPRFLRACRGEPVDRTPLWIMRQAGRYLPEYREVRAKTTFLGLCKTAELAAEVTLQPLARYELDAGIIFSDILIPVEAMGAKLEFDEGPYLPEKIKTQADVDKLFVPDPVKTMGFVGDAIRMVKKARPDIPLLGFAGAPFTLASYLIEGGGSTSYAETKKLMYTEPKLARGLLDKLAQTVAVHLLMQIEAGCDAVQIFDSWAGHLSKEDFQNFALPFIVKIVEAVKPKKVPIIVFAKGAHASLGDLAEIGADVLGVDWTTPLADARKATGDRVVLQGNLDPCVLLGPIERMEREVQRICNEMIDAKGHIFNLGHGVLPPTPPEHVAALVDAVKRSSKRRVPSGLQ